ncbi:hypothetical protein ACFC1W_07230 [Microbacterium sp. NPDC056003]|uniref:hypothetical protein n=1 Tax=Microbacterium sp. NPDC056003 TaxID=3345676 RepID=UPI0035DC53F7
MTFPTLTAPASWRVQWRSLDRGDWEAGRGGRKVGAVRRERGVYVASTPRGRTVGEFETLPEALDAVGRTPLSSVDSAQVWTALLVTVNVAMVASLAAVASALLS